MLLDVGEISLVGLTIPNSNLVNIIRYIFFNKTEKSFIDTV
jgi:hypothetical protein